MENNNDEKIKEYKKLNNPFYVAELAKVLKEIGIPPNKIAKIIIDTKKDIRKEIMINKVQKLSNQIIQEIKNL